MPEPMLTAPFFSITSMRNQYADWKTWAICMHNMKGFKKELFQVKSRSWWWAKGLSTSSYGQKGTDITFQKLEVGLFQKEIAPLWYLKIMLHYIIQILWGQLWLRHCPPYSSGLLNSWKVQAPWQTQEHVKGLLGAKHTPLILYQK